MKEFLFDKAIEHEVLAHSIHWHLELERTNNSNQPKTLDYYMEVWKEFMSELERDN